MGLGTRPWVPDMFCSRAIFKDHELSYRSAGYNPVTRVHCKNGLMNIDEPAA